MLPEATEDVQSEAEGWFVSGWWAAYKSQPVQVTDLLPIAMGQGSIVIEYWGGVPASGAAKLGHFLRGIRGKTFNVTAITTTPATIVVVRKLTNDSVTRRARYQLACGARDDHAMV